MAKAAKRSARLNTKLEASQILAAALVCAGSAKAEKTANVKPNQLAGSFEAPDELIGHKTREKIRRAWLVRKHFRSSLGDSSQ